MTDRASDEPLNDPEKDLLGLALHARILAGRVRQVPTPFTIGIYGEWGAGKTTFVNFLHHYLEEGNGSSGQAAAVEFITFQAWPFRTADELWRALIITIAKRLYGIKEEEKRLLDAEDDGGARGTWRDLLGRDAVVVREPKTAPTGEEKYRRLLTLLDQTLYGGIGKSEGAPWRLDREEALVAAVSASVSALGVVSPLVAGLRGLLGGEGRPEAARQLQRDKNEATRGRIESVEAFRRIFKELIESQAQGKRLCIFIDDLDRCMPDVALDLLEAIKIFVVDAEFVFVVAAYEQLIGEGLRLRYRDSGGGPSDERLARMGREYLEKIVQLRIHIPEFTATSIQRFVAAQFPEWMPATDIICSAVGSNPRRVKQQCAWLAFQRAAIEEAPEDSPDDVLLLEKLIALYSRDEAVLARLAERAGRPDYAESMRALESHLDALDEDPGEERIAARVADTEMADLVRRITSVGPLLKLFRSPKRFSEFPPARVATLAAIADLRPHPSLMLAATDRPFMRILTLVNTGEALVPKLMLDDFTRLVGLREHGPQLLQCAHDLAQACGDRWGPDMAAVEAALEVGQADPGLSAPARALYDEAIRPPAPAEAGADRRALVLQAPRLSEMLWQEVLAFCGLQATLPAAESLLTSHDVAVQASDAEKQRRLGAHALSGLDPKARDDIQERLKLRQWAAQRCLGMRSFAKLNALDRCWPDLARRLRTDFAAIRMLEHQFQQPASVAGAYAKLWDRYKHDEDLASFFALRPFFGDIPGRELQRYVSVSQVLAPTGASAVVATARPPATSEDAAAESRRPGYLDVILALAPPPSEVVPSSLPVPEYELTLHLPDKRTIPSSVHLPWSEIDAALREVHGLSGLGSAVPAVTRDLAQRVAEPEGARDIQALVKSLGGRLFDVLFGSDVLKEVDGLLDEDRQYRFVWRLPSELTALPIESLYVKRRREFLGLTQRFSLVRERESPSPPRSVALAAPLRVLAVLANPRDMAPLDLDGEEEMLRRALGQALEERRASLEIMGRRPSPGGPREPVTLGDLQERVRTFRPHFFHFVGHGLFRSDQGHIVLDGPHGQSHLVAAEEVKVLLGDAKIRVAVLHGCDTGVSSRNDALSSVAGALVSAGVPAVIATMRPIADEAALLFTREFYRTICEGYPVETALAEARKRLSMERWDWSAYALFTSAVAQLEDLAIQARTVTRES